MRAVRDAAKADKTVGKGRETSDQGCCNRLQSVCKRRCNKAANKGCEGSASKPANHCVQSPTTDAPKRGHPAQSTSVGETHVLPVAQVFGRLLALIEQQAMNALRGFLEAHTAVAAQAEVVAVQFGTHPARMG